MLLSLMPENIVLMLTGRDFGWLAAESLVSSRFILGWVFAKALKRFDFSLLGGTAADLPVFFRTVEGLSCGSGLCLDVAKASDPAILKPDFAPWSCVLCEALFEDGVAFDAIIGGLAPVRRY